MFQDAIRRFARERIGPYVREMDAAAIFRKELLREMFQLGLMGIEIPEEYGGQGGSFFQAVLAVEALAAVDPSAAVIVDVQNTIANNVIIRWGTRRSEAALFAEARQRHGRLVRIVGSWLRLGRIRAGHSRHQARRRVFHHRPQTLDHQRRARPACSCCSPTPIPKRAIAASLVSWWSASFPDFKWARKKTSWAFAHRQPAS